MRQGSCATVDWSSRLRYLRDDLEMVWMVHLESPWEEAEAVHREDERGGEKAQAEKDPRGEWRRTKTKNPGASRASRHGQLQPIIRRILNRASA